MTVIRFKYANHHFNSQALQFQNLFGLFIIEITEKVPINFPVHFAYFGFEYLLILRCHLDFSITRFLAQDPQIIAQDFSIFLAGLVEYRFVLFSRF